MGRYHCDNVAEQLQAIKGVTVKDVTASSWSFLYKSAKATVRVLPGCCGILLFHNVTGGERDALGLIKATLRAATKAKFGLLVLSLRTDSKLTPLLGEGWNKTPFINPRTNNSVELLSFKLPTKIVVKKQRPVLEDY